MSEAHPKSDGYLQALGELIRSDARESRMVLSAGPAWILARTAPGMRRIMLESPSSQYLPRSHKLTPGRAKELRERGYVLEDRGRLFRRTATTDATELERISREVFAVLGDIYAADVAGDIRLDILHDQREHPSNPSLLDAMRKAAGSYDDQQRLALYNEMVNSTLLVPVDPEADETMDGGEEYLSLEKQERPVFGAFTDWDALRMWQPRGWEYVPVHGSELVEQAVELRAAGIRFNADGDVGGEVYPHEIETMAKGVRIWRRRGRN